MLHIKQAKKINTVSKNKNAFTLLEALMGLMVMGVICMLILQMMLLMSRGNNEFYNDRQTILFTMQIQRDLIATKHINTNQSTVELEKHNEVIASYSVRNKKLIRSGGSTNFSGEVVLNNIKKIEFYKDNNILKAEVQYENEKETRNITIGKEKF